MAEPAANNILDFEVHILPKQGEHYPVHIRLGDGGDFAGTFSTADILPWVSTGNLVQDGRRLFNALFADKLHTAWDNARGRESQYRVRLWIDAAAAELHTLPWELLHDGEVWLSANARTPFSRYLTSEVPWGGPVAERPIRVLVVISNPKNLKAYSLLPIDAAQERALLEQAFAGFSPEQVELTFLDPPVTLAKLEQALHTGYHVVHFVGHGTFGQRSQQAALYLQDDAGNANIVTDEQLNTILKQQPARPHLVFLAACQSATRSTLDAFAGLGPKLIRAGIPTVVAMQAQISVRAAQQMTPTFYADLMVHGEVDRALNAARSNLLAAHPTDAAVPVLFMRLQNGRLWANTAEINAYLAQVVPDYEMRMYQRVLGTRTTRDQPYKFLYPFEIEDADIFFGRDAATQACHRAVCADRLTVLHAKSGAGKTSLLHAGLAPRLLREGRLPVYARAYRDPVLAIKRAIVPQPWPEGLSELPLAEFLHCVCTYLSRQTQELVIILDQFEEFFIFWREPERCQPFVDVLAECYEDKALPVRFVIAIRKDYYSDLADFQGRLPTILYNEYRLGVMTRKEAQAAIVGPVAKTGHPVTYERALLDALLDDLAGGGMELPHLQIICTRLYEALPAGEMTITLDMYADSGRATGILGGYLDRVLDRLPGKGRKIAEDVLKELVSSESTKQVLSYTTLAARVDAETCTLDDVLLRLVNTRLLRRDEVAGEVVYEMAHEYLIEKVKTWMSETDLEQKRIKGLLEREVLNWRGAGLLIRPEVWALVNEHREALERLEIEELELLFHTAVEIKDEVSYWLERAHKGGAGDTVVRYVLGHDNVQVRVDFLKTLAQWGEQYREDVIKMLEDDHYQIRLAVVAVLEQWGEQYVAGIIKVLADKYPQVRVAAITALEHLQPDDTWREHLVYECYVPSGPFIMGDDNSDQDNEKPANEVTLDAFYIGKYPVTNAEYKRYMDDVGKPFTMPSGKEQHPVRSITWSEARDYAAWAELRLPTEAEWEKAASWDAGHKRRYPWGDAFDPDKCNTRESGIDDTTPVGQYSPQGDSPYGCADMAGNVWEWINSVYEDYPYRANDGREDVGASDCRVVRGGSYSYNASYVRCAYRYLGSGGDIGFADVGLRVCVAAPFSPDSGL